MANINDLRKNFCLVYLKDLKSIQNLIDVNKNKKLNDLIHDLENYLDQFNCVKNSSLLIDLKDKVIFKISSYINDKVLLIKLIL